RSRSAQPDAGLRPAILRGWRLRQWSSGRWGWLPPALGHPRQPAEAVELLRIGPADARGPQPGRPTEAHPSPLAPGVQRILGDPHRPGQIDDEPLIRAECGSIGLRWRLIARRPPPHEEADDVLVESPGALGWAESFLVELLGDSSERPPLASPYP